MKKSTKKAITGAIIFAVTLFSGFGITAVSFNLFDVMSRNQMRLIFALDVILLLVIGAIAWFVYEHKSAKKIRKKKFEKRHNERLCKIESQKSEILSLLKSENFAA